MNNVTRTDPIGKKFGKEKTVYDGCVANTTWEEKPYDEET